MNPGKDPAYPRTVSERHRRPCPAVQPQLHLHDAGPTHPYLMWDWKSVARGYDALVFDLSRTGQ